MDGRLSRRAGGIGLGRLERIRRGLQLAVALVANANVPGFISGQIYTGASKSVCVPFLNCYSCPGALGACPVGTLQALVVSRTLPLYALGTVLAAGGLAGRAICGWLCPFGLLQELVWRGRGAGARLPAMLLRLKYVVMVGMLPAAAWLVGQGGVGVTYFCAYLCPAGTLEAGIPLLLANPSLRPLAGPVLAWKLAVLVVFAVAAVRLARPFCRTLCPLGAFYGLLNRYAVLRMHFDSGSCVHCGACKDACSLGIDATVTPNSNECVRCLRCTQVCPSGALSFGWRRGAGIPPD